MKNLFVIFSLILITLNIPTQINKTDKLRF